MTTMSSDNLKANLTNPQRAYLWEVTFPTIVGGGEANVLNIRCQSTAIPGSGVGTILIPYKQTAGIKFPGKRSVTHTWTAVFVEGTDGKVFEALNGWNQAIVNTKLGTGGPDIVIKKDIYLALLDAQGAVTRRIKLMGAYPELIDEVPLSYEGDNEVKFTATFSYDDWQDV